MAGGGVVQMNWWTFHSGSLRLELGGDGGDAVAGPGQNVLVGQKDDAEVFGSLLLPKTRSGHDDGTRLLDDFGAEGAIIHPQVDGGEGVERAFGGHAGDSGNGVEPI